MERNKYHFRTLDKARGSKGYSLEKPITARFTWKDKAGGYGIQDPFGMKYIKKIDGDYYNVVGLPVSRLVQELRKFGIEI